jgi:hypothetical protein
MADLRGQQIKDRFQSLVTLSDTSSNPTSAQLQNGNGTNLNGIGVGCASAGANTVALGTNNIERIRFDSAGNVGIGVSNPTHIIDVATGVERKRTAGTQLNKFYTSKNVSASGAVTALQITVPVIGFFMFIKMTFANSRAPSTNVGTSGVGERYFSIGRNGSGFDVVLDSNLGSKDWTSATTSAGSTADTISSVSTIVRNGAEANTEPQVVNITFNPSTTGGSTGSAVLDFEILCISNQLPTIV